MAHAFISYARVNAGAVRCLIAALQNAGHTAWFDQRSVRVGESWERAIGRGIADSDVLLLALSSGAVRSRWVLRELAIAHEQHRPVLPVLIEPLSAEEFPASIRDQKLQVIRMHGDAFDDGLRRLLKELPSSSSGASSRIPFVVRHPRLHEFVGRDQELRQLHDELMTVGSRGLRPVGIHGMGGIGKTQLAVQYAHYYRYHYPDGVFLVDAQNDWAEEFARLARRSRLVQSAYGKEVASVADAAAAMIAYIDENRRALVIFDGVDRAADLTRGTIARLESPANLSCHLLFTTRRRFQTNGIRAVPLGVLSPRDAGQVLCQWREDCRRDPNVAQVCAALGYLPLMLALGAAFLRKKRNAQPAAYLDLVRSHGAELANTRANLSEQDVEAYASASIQPALAAQWSLLEAPGAEEIIKLASLAPENAHIPLARLGLLSGLIDAEDGIDTHLSDAVGDAVGVHLLEQLDDSMLVLHPIVRQYIQKRELPRAASLAEVAATRLIDAYEDFAVLERECGARSVDGVQEDLRTTDAFLPSTSIGPSTRLNALLRALQQEAHVLRLDKWLVEPPANLVPQVLLARAEQLGDKRLASLARRRLTEVDLPYVAIVWQNGGESAGLVRTIFAHGGIVGAVAVAGDGVRILSAGQKEIRAWSLETGRQIVAFTRHEAEITAVLPIGPSRVLSASADGALLLWSLDSNDDIRELECCSAAVSCMEATPNGRHLAAGTRDGTVAVWDVETGTHVWASAAHRGEVTAIAIGPNGDRVVSAAGEDDLRVWSLADGALLRRYGEHTLGVDAITFLPSGLCASAAAFHTGEFRVWDAESGQTHMCLRDPRLATRNLLTTPDARFLVTDFGSTPLLWEVLDDGGLRGHAFVGHGHHVTGIAVTPDAKHLVSSSWDGTVRLWRLDPRLAAAPNPAHLQRVKRVGVTGDGSTIVSASLDGNVKTWDAETGRNLLTLRSGGSPVWAMVLTSDGDRIVAGAESGRVDVWDRRSGQLRQSFNAEARWRTDSDSHGRTVDLTGGPRSAVTELVAMSDNRHVVARSATSTYLWDLAEGEQTFVERNMVDGVAAVPGSPHALFSYLDRCRLWNFESRQADRAVREKRSGAVAVTSDRRYLISLVKDSVTVYDMASGDEVDTWAQLAESVPQPLVVSAHGTFFGVFRGARHGMFASDVYLSIRELESGEIVGHYVHSRIIHALAVVPDTMRIVIGDDSGVIACLEYVEPRNGPKT